MQELVSDRCLKGQSKLCYKVTSLHYKQTTFFKSPEPLDHHLFVRPLVNILGFGCRA